jgi:outer membrane protein assembly factor BamB
MKKTTRIESAPVAGGKDLRPLVPPRRVWITLASLAAATFLVRSGWLEPIVGSIVDQAVRNIITLILCFSALMTLLLWFVRESGHANTLKQAMLGGLLGAVVVCGSVLRIERVSGDLVPEFAFRWSPSRDRLLPQHRAGAVTPAEDAAAAAAPWRASPGDFSRFLGPSGSCGIDSPVLDPDWQARPPRLLWKRPIGAGWSGFATCGDHAVTLEQRGDEEIVSCCSVVTGAPEWAVAVKGRHETVLGGVGPRSTPTIHDGVVYAHGATGWLHAIDGATGRVLWKKDVLDELGIDPVAHGAMVSWGRAASPLVTDDLVIVPAGGPRTRRSAQDPEFLALVAFDRATGERRWTTGDEQISYVSPQLVDFGGRQMIVSVNEAHVAGYDPTDGHEIFEHPWLGHSNSDASCSQAVPIGDSRLFLSKGYGIGAAVFEIEKSDAEPWTLREVWRNAGLLKTKFTNVAMHEGHAYGLSDGILECVSVADGKRRWKGGRYGQGQVLRAGPLLLVQAESGEVVLVEASPEKHAVRGRLAAIDGQTWNNLSLSGNRLLVRNAEEAAGYEVPVISESDKPGEPAGASEPVAAGPGTAKGNTP